LSVTGRRFLGLDGATQEPGLALLLEAEAVALDVQNRGMMKEPVEDGGGSTWSLKVSPQSAKLLSGG